VRNLLLIGISAIISGGVSVAAAQPVQQPVNERRFDSASVKPTLSPYEAGFRAARGEKVPTPFMGIQTQPGGRFLAGASLKQLIAYAYGMHDYQIEGGPTWLASDYFEVIANAGADATPADVRSMVRSLLAERFALRVHTDTRDAQMQVLTLARPDGRLGPRLTRTTPKCLKEIADRTISGAPPPPMPGVRGGFPTTPTCGQTMTMGRGTGATARLLSNVELSSLASELSSELAAPVLDKTGLSGPFDIALEYLSERLVAGRAPGLDANSTDTLPPTLVPALQQQLGLKLEKQVAPMPVVVVDAADHPTPN